MDFFMRFTGVYTVLLYLVIALIAFLVLNKLLFIVSHRYNPNAVHWVFFHRLLKVIILIIVSYGILASVPQFQSVSTMLLTSSSILVAAVGLASQDSLSNAVSSLVISLFKPFAVGDRVRLVNLGLTGIVEDINFRHTTICTFENNRLLIPNSLLNKEIIENSNHLDSRVCNFLDVSITYESDIEKAKTILFDLVTNHKLFTDPRTARDIENGMPKARVLVRNIIDGKVDLRIGVWANTVAENFLMCSEIRSDIVRMFYSEGIKFYQQTIVTKFHEDDIPV